MAITLKWIGNGDDILLRWREANDRRIDKCVGFAIERRLQKPMAQPEQGWLKNRVGFADRPAQHGETRPSDVWPFQCYGWTDHEVSEGDVVSYRVVPVCFVSADRFAPDEAQASAWTPSISVGKDLGQGITPYFNRGLSASQFVARYLKAMKIGQRQLVDSIIDHTSSMRTFMGGPLLKALETLLKEVAADASLTLYASLFELRDHELVELLCNIKGRANVVLGDGSPKEPSAKRPQGEADPNADARKDLGAAGVKVTDRLVAWNPAGQKKTGALSHNKFLVIADAAGPRTVWTGSTNWTPSGLCTQANNAARIENRDVAALFFKQWERLRDAKSNAPSTLAKGNGAPAGPAGDAHFQAWFTPTVSRAAGKRGADIEELMSICRGARQGILFLMFMPGDEPLATIIGQRGKGIYVRGVTNQYTKLPDTNEEGEEGEFELHTPTQSIPFKDAAPNPSGIKDEFGYWLGEVQLNTLGVLIHSKVIVTDPLGPSPTVVLGSHNFSRNASTANDENFVVVRGDSALAQAYATNIMSTYDHYRWRHHLKTAADPWRKLVRSDTWQDTPETKIDPNELRFWF